MSGYLLFDEARHRLDEMLDYSFHNWGEVQATAYIDGLLETCAAIAARDLPWRTIPEYLGVDGYYYRYRRHVIYWRVLGEDEIGVTTILHERMDQVMRVREAFND